jgi:hypothetical protein
LASEGSNNWFTQSGFRVLQRAEELQDYRNTHRGELDEEDLSEERVEQGIIPFLEEHHFQPNRL